MDGKMGKMETCTASTVRSPVVRSPLKSVYTKYGFSLEYTLYTDRLQLLSNFLPGLFFHVAEMSMRWYGANR